MAEMETIVGEESAMTMVEQLGKAFIELESYRDASSSYGILWEEIKEHFQNLENALKVREDELKEKEKAFEQKKSEAQALIAEREVAVAEKELASVDRIQELKDAAVAAIAEAREKYITAYPEPADVGKNKEIKVSISTIGDHNAPNSVQEEKSPDNRSGGSAEAVSVEVKPRPLLKQLCEQMDAKGLLKFLLENRKNLASIREELPIALNSASEPARLVLDALEGFYPLDQTPSQGNEKDMALQSLRRVCLMLMESVTPLLGITEPGGDHPLSSETKQQAKAIANEWKPKLAGVDIDAANGNTLEAQAFLQLLATFDIASEFDDDELCKLVLAISRRRQAPELCRSLGLAHKVRGVIEVLVANGRQIDAVHFAHAFQLTESFPPVPLLKVYLKDLNENIQEKNGNAGVAGIQKDVRTQELGALRAVIGCIEKYNLQADYPLEPLKKRVAEIEKEKSSKKKMGEAPRFHAKKPRGNAGFGSRVPSVAAEMRRTPNVFDERGLYYGASERYPYTIPPPYNYQVPSHSSYGQQVNAQRPYYYPDERVPPTPYGAPPSSYGSYAGTDLPSTHQSYM